jgi:hypothetical protein
VVSLWSQAKRPRLKVQSSRAAALGVSSVCAVSADALEGLIQVRRADPEILLRHPEDPEERLRLIILRS